jgi:tRNA (cytidine32/uridine32-2'-O)-methyltransferase
MSENLRIVLVGTQHPGNIGSAARAMKTMGLSRLVLVAPLRFPHADAEALAAGAGDVLATAEIHATLAEAVADCRLVIATTARQRTVPMAELTAGEAARRLVEESAHGGVALVFGRERTGLENEELQRCHASVTLPANPDYSSLNVAAAVQILAYELRLAELASKGNGEAPAGLDPETEPATQREMENFFLHLMAFMADIDFHKGHSPAIVEQRLRRLFLRAQPSPRELRILRGILSDSQRLLRLSRPD